ncbi:MAG: hypothetical protein DRN81_07555, partial [Thermoproteota archaeon]
MRSARTLNLVLIIVLLISNFLPTVAPVSASPQAFVEPQRTPARTVDAAETVNITDTSFDPATVTIRPGETVEWVNQTAQVQRIVGGVPYRIYLPLVLRDAGGLAQRNYGNDDVTATPSAGQMLAQSDGWGSGDIQPGGWFTHAFAAPGKYPYFLAGSPEFTGTVIVQGEPQPDFEIGVAPAARTVIQGGVVTYTVSLTATNGFTVPVTLSISDLPTGAAPTWNTNPVTPIGSTVLTVTTAAGTPTGDHLFTVIGTGGGQSHDVQATLTVESSTMPNFALDVTPDSRSVAQEQATSYDVSLTAIYGFADPVTLAVGGLPAGTAPTWGENPLTPSAATVLTITASDTTPVGNYTLTITATGGGITHTDSVQLSITTPSMPNLIVQTIATDPEVPVANQPSQLQVGIATVGTGHAPADFPVDWYADPPMPPTSTTPGDGVWTQRGLSTHGVVTLTTAYTFTTAGTHVFYAQVDRTGVITESDESDN